MKIRLLLILFIVFTSFIATSQSSTAVNCEGIKINELLPNPAGVDTNKEWIELYNCSSDTVNIEGWYIIDKANGKQVLSKYYLEPDEFYLFYTTISLNQTDETIGLYTKEGNLMDYISYSSSVEEKSLSRIPDGIGDLQITIQTPGERNFVNINEFVIINEIYPSPNSGEVEWLELYNDNDFEVSLYNWILQDLTGQFKLADKTIQAKGYLVIDEDLKISLSNSGDTISLLNTQGEIIDAFVYQNTPKGISNIRIFDSISQTKLPTPWKVNQLVELTDEFFGLNNISIQEFKETQATNSMITGTITLLPDIFLKNRMYIQDETSGILVKLPETLPDLEQGGTYRICGNYGTYYTSLEIIIKNSNCIQKIETNQPIMPQKISEYLDIKQNEGNLIKIIGQISAITEKDITLSFDDKSIKILLDPNIQISFQKDDLVEIIGVINQYQEDKFKIFATSINSFDEQEESIATGINGVSIFRFEKSINPVKISPTKETKVYYSKTIKKDPENNKNKFATSGGFFTLGNILYIFCIKRYF